MDQLDSSYRSRRKSKSFHFEETNSHHSPRPPPEQRRRESLDGSSAARRRKRGSPERRPADRGASLERRPPSERRRAQPPRRPPKTVIHALDRTGKCLFHPRVVLRKKAIFGVLGGWVDVLRSCPECEEEDLRRLNGGGAGPGDGSGRAVGAGAGSGSGARGGERQQHQHQQAAQQPDGAAQGRRRRRTPSPANDRRERTPSPLRDRRAAAEATDRPREKRDRTLSPSDKSRREQAAQQPPTATRARRDRTLSPVDSSRRRAAEGDQQQQKAKKKSFRKEKGRDEFCKSPKAEREEHRYRPPPPTRHAPKERSRTLSPIDRSRSSAKSFGSKKKGRHAVGGGSCDSESSRASEEDVEQQRRKPSDRVRNGSWKARITNNSKSDRRANDHGDGGFEESGRSNRTRKKNALGVSKRRGSKDNPDDFIASYLLSGTIPGAAPDKSRRDISKRCSLGTLDKSSNSSNAGDWKNLSDVAHQGKKYAEKMIKRGRKKVNEVKSRGGAGAWGDTAEDLFSDDEKVDCGHKDFVCDVDSDEKHPPSSRRNRSKPLDSSSGTAYDSYGERIPQSPRQRQQSPPQPYQKQPLADPPSDVRCNYEKSWSADGIRVHASASMDEGETAYSKAQSIDSSVYIAGENLQPESMQFEQRQKKYEKGFLSFDESHAHEERRRCNNETRDDDYGDKSLQESLGALHTKYDTHRKSLQSTKSQATEPTCTSETIDKSNRKDDGKDSSPVPSEKFNSQDMDTMNMDNLMESLMHEYMDPHEVNPSESCGKISSQDIYSNIEDDDSSAESVTHRNARVEPPENVVPETNSSPEDVAPRATNEVEDEQAVESADESSDQSEDHPPPLPFPAKPKLDALPRVRSIGNLTIDLTALQASKPTKVETKPVEVKPQVKPPSKPAEDSSDSGSEKSIKIDRAALQHRRPKRMSVDDKVKTFDTSNLPWTGRFGESGMYTGSVNEQYQPHGRGTMLYDSGEMKKGHWKDGDFVRESGAYSDSEDDDDSDEDDGEGGDLSSSMMNLSQSMSSKYGRDRSRSRSKDRGESQPPPPPPPPPSPPPTYQIGELGKHRDMILEVNDIKELIPKLKADDGAFIRRSDGKWTYAVVKTLETNAGTQAIRFTVNERNSSKSYVEKYWLTHIRPMRAVALQQPSSDTSSTEGREGRSKQRDPAGKISRQSSMTSLSSTSSDKEQKPTERVSSCPPVTRLFGARSRSRSRRRACSFSPMRTLCSISESDMEDDDSDGKDDDSFGGNRKMEITGMHTMSQDKYALRGIDP